MRKGTGEMVVQVRLQRLWLYKLGPSVSPMTTVMIVAAFVAIELVACMGTATVAARNGVPDAPPQNASPGVTLPRELDLELQLQVARDERDQVLNRYEALQVQMQQLVAIVDQFIGQAQAGRIEAGNKSRAEIAAKLVKALGGDPEKGDTFDWRDRALVRKDGTKVPIAKPETKQ